ncbi:MAG: protein kinase family protein, partial [Angustibacter sp.]
MSHPHSAAVLDAARRAASVTDPRLARILDIGEGNSGCYVVYEWIQSPSLEVQLISGPLSAAQARAIVGECAAALDIAQQLGIHHLCLSPAQVYVLPDGNIRLTELAVAAALRGIDVSQEEWTGPRAAAADARALVGLCYAALTGRWPFARGQGPLSLLPQANTVLGQPVAPAQLIAGVPADLDLLCAQTFGADGAPANPGLVAAALAPWRSSDAAQRSAGLPPPADSGSPTILLSPIEPSSRVEPRDQAQGESRPEPGLGTAMFAAVPSAPAPDVSQDWQSQWVAGHDVTPGGRTESQSKVVIAVFGAFIVAMAFLGFFGLRGLTDGLSFRDKPASPAPDLPGGGTSAKASSPPPGGAPVRIASGRGFDPEGDGEENDERAARAFDKKPDTNWDSQTYKTALFGSLKKGVGIEITFAQSSTIRQVQLTGAVPGTEFEIRPASGNTLSSTVLASASATRGPVTLSLSEPITAKSIVIWSTKP